MGGIQISKDTQEGFFYELSDRCNLRNRELRNLGIFFFFFYIQSKQLQYILLNYTTYKKLYPTTSTIPCEAKTMTTIMAT